MDLLVTGMLVFLLCSFGARWISERALRTLSGEEKVRLVEAFAAMRTYGLLWSAGLLAAMFLLPKAFPDPRSGLYVGLVLAVAFVIVRQVLTARKVKALQLDPAYAKKIGQAQLLGSIGFAALIACVVLAM